MPKQLTREQVIALAKLAQLKLHDDEIDRYQGELSGILDYIDKLSEADTSNVEPTYQVTGLQNVTRDDVVRDQLATPSELLAVTPGTQDNYIRVKRMI
jgi:aspartyl-tRNA(Asn)/glutamyl-tRNA(Gln) amidotransferase subunit C